MGCEEAGINFSEKDGFYVDKHLKTSNDDVFALGDCIAMDTDPKSDSGPGYQFTHNSDVQARSVVRNALFFGSVDRTKVLLPWSTYTDPEIAHVGQYSW